jgi:hypothetical protein
LELKRQRTQRDIGGHINSALESASSWDLRTTKNPLVAGFKRD